MLICSLLLSNMVS